MDATVLRKKSKLTNIDLTLCGLTDWYSNSVIKMPFKCNSTGGLNLTLDFDCYFTGGRWKSSTAVFTILSLSSFK